MTLTKGSLASQTIPQPTVIWVDGVAIHPNDCRLWNGLAQETKLLVCPLAYRRRSLWQLGWVWSVGEQQVTIGAGQ